MDYKSKNYYNRKRMEQNLMDKENAAGVLVSASGTVQNILEMAPPRTSLTSEISRYLTRKRAKGLTEGSIEQYSIVLNAFSNYTSLDLSEITDWEVINFLDNYEQVRGISKRRKENMRIILNGFFRYETDAGNIKTNPMISIDSIKVKKNVRTPLTDIELELLREACIDLRDKALLEFFFATGCRVSEVIKQN